MSEARKPKIRNGRAAGARAGARPPAPPELPPDAHKGQAGRVLCLCGSAEMPGAAVLVVRAAQRAGAGLVTLACLAPSLASIVPIAAPEAILADWGGLVTGAGRRARGVRGGAGPALAGRRDHARVAGPGLGAGARTRAWVWALVESGFEGPLVLDADALNVIGTDLGFLRAHPGPLVLTPHPGEAARLLGREIPGDDRGRRAAAREISARSGALCILKGRRTVVAEGERVYVNTSGNPGMATAGAGDVLTGILGAYLAACSVGLDRAWTPFEAAASAVSVHGEAGDLAARARGTRGLVASDLIEHLPEAQRAAGTRGRARSARARDANGPARGATGRGLHSRP